MALIETEMAVSTFNNLVQMLASTAPIPMGTLLGLPSGQLITQWDWKKVEVGHLASGAILAPGSLPARANVTVRHVSIAELEIDADAQGTSTIATAWLALIANASGLRIEIIAIDLPDASRQWFAPAQLIVRRSLPNLGVPAASATLLLRDEIVTLRLATRMTDDLSALPLNLLATKNEGNWAIRISGDAFTEILLEGLQSALSSLDEVNIEDAPNASWRYKDGQWAAVGSIGVDKIDACSGLFGDVDLSITIEVILTPSANHLAEPPWLALRLHVASDVSDWDSFRCWLGSGALASGLLGIVATPLVGPALGGLSFLGSSIVSVAALAETVRLNAGHQLKSTDVDDFVEVSHTPTSTTYLGGMRLPNLLDTGFGGKILSTTTGDFGMLIAGWISYVPATHHVIFNPANGALSAKLRNFFDCGTRTWLRKADMQAFEIEDHPQIIVKDLGRVPVTLFRSSVATPANLWSIPDLPPALTQSVVISASEFIQPGDIGRIYLHTSAGIRRFDINALSPLVAPTPVQTALALSQCLAKTKRFTPKQELEWLVDPPPYDYGRPPLRQWLFTFAELEADTRVVIGEFRTAREQLRRFEIGTKQAGEAHFEIITAADTRVILEHNQRAIENGRIRQRWLLTTHVIDIGGPGLSLMRSGHTLAITQHNGVMIYDLSTGFLKRHNGRYAVAKLASGTFELSKHVVHTIGIGHSSDTSTVAWNQSSMLSRREARSEVAHSETPATSITLPGGKVAALFNHALLIARPWRGD